jgi:lambda repressor-like predicted transcriptional regulator
VQSLSTFFKSTRRPIRKNQIKALFRKAVAKDGLTMPEIARHAAISWSTVRNVLKKRDSGFVRENDVWFEAEE